MCANTGLTEFVVFVLCVSACVRKVFFARYFRHSEFILRVKQTHAIQFFDAILFVDVKADDSIKLHINSWWIVLQSKVEIDRHERHL